MSSLSTLVSWSRVMLGKNLLAHRALSWHPAACESLPPACSQEAKKSCKSAFCGEVSLTYGSCPQLPCGNEGSLRTSSSFCGRMSSSCYKWWLELAFPFPSRWRERQCLLAVCLVVVGGKRTRRVGKSFKDLPVPSLRCGRTRCWRYDIFSPYRCQLELADLNLPSTPTWKVPLCLGEVLVPRWN